MPLLFEINETKDNNIKILCFVPSGYRVGTEFVNFPAQYGPSCWHHAAFRLFTLTCTENGFDINTQPEIVQIITSMKDFISNLEYMKQLWMEMAKELFKKASVNPEQITTKLSQIDSIMALKQMFNILNFLNAKYEYALTRIFAQNKDIFFTEFVNILTTINAANKAQTQTTANQTELTMKNVIDDQHTQILCAKLEELQEKPIITAKIMACISFSLDSFRLYTEKMRINGYLHLINHLHLNALGLITGNNTADIDCNMWPHILYQLLNSKGPILVHGYVGSVFYKNCEPKKVLDFGSLSLYGYESSKYVNDGVAGHVVLIIGIVDNKVIYLDPADESCVTGPKRAYVMNIQKFMERVIEYQKHIDPTVTEPTVTFTQLPAGAIDTSLELMLEQLYGKTPSSRRSPSNLKLG